MEASLQLEPPSSRAIASERAPRGSAFTLALWASGLLLALGCVYAIALCSCSPDVGGHALGSDDAFISYRYARNWAEGHGIVFNVGERVEGYTNFLYVALMTVPFLLRLDVLHFSVFVNTLFALGAWWLFVRRVQSRHGTRAALVGGYLFALSPSIWLWVASGLETPLVLLLQVAIWVSVETTVERREPHARSLALLYGAIALLVLTRADGFVTGALAAGYLFVRGQRRAALLAAATVACFFGALLAWRWGYYHDVLPNTYYAKVTSSLLRRVQSAVHEFGGIVSRQGIGVYVLATIAGAGAVLARLARRGLSSLSEVSFGLVFTVAWLAYWIYVGGDIYEDRFLLILIPVGISLMFATVLRDVRRSSLYFVAAVAVLMQLLPVVRLNQYGKQIQAKYDYRVKVGQFLKDRWGGRDTVLATGAAGKIPYYSEMRTIDTLGLCDVHIGHMTVKDFIPGHSKHDSEYVLSLKPDLILEGFDGDGLDIAYMAEERYRTAGYHLRYIVNTSDRSRGDDDILDVSGRSRADIVLLSHIGWRGALLEREATQAKDPT